MSIMRKRIIAIIAAALCIVILAGSLAAVLEYVSIIEYDSIFNKSFVIKQGKTKVAKMKKKLSLIGQKLHIKNLEWDVKGNFLAKEYTITKGEEAIAEIKKSKLLALTESYAITINNDENAANVVAVALILNQILKNKKGKLLKKAIGK